MVLHVAHGEEQQHVHHLRGKCPGWKDELAERWKAARQDGAPPPQHRPAPADFAQEMLDFGRPDGSGAGQDHPARSRRSFPLIDYQRIPS